MSPPSPRARRRRPRPAAASPTVAATDEGEEKIGSSSRGRSCVGKTKMCKGMLDRGLKQGWTLSDRFLDSAQTLFADGSAMRANFALAVQALVGAAAAQRALAVGGCNVSLADVLALAAPFLLGQVSYPSGGATSATTIKTLAESGSWVGLPWRALTCVGCSARDFFLLAMSVGSQFKRDRERRKHFGNVFGVVQRLGGIAMFCGAGLLAQQQHYAFTSTEARPAATDHTSQAIAVPAEPPVPVFNDLAGVVADVEPSADISTAAGTTAAEETAAEVPAEPADAVEVSGQSATSSTTSSTSSTSVTDSATDSATDSSTSSTSSTSSPSSPPPPPLQSPVSKNTPSTTTAAAAAAKQAPPGRPGPWVLRPGKDERLFPDHY